MNSPSPVPSRRADLPLTHWSLVRRAFPQEQPAACLKSQDEFCRIYWPVIHLFLKQKHHYSHHDAEDLAQGFVAWLLASGSMAKSREEHGRFRSYLLAHLDNFVRNHHQKQHAGKRGGGTREVPLQDAEAAAEPSLADERTPDQALARAWSIATLREAHQRLCQAYRERGKEALFTQLLPFLSTHTSEHDALTAAHTLGLTLPAFRMARSRFRKEFGQTLADLVSATVNNAEDFAEEMKLLREIVG